MANPTVPALVRGETVIDMEEVGTPSHPVAGGRIQNFAAQVGVEEESELKRSQQP